MSAAIRGFSRICLPHFSKKALYYPKLGNISDIIRFQASSNASRSINIKPSDISRTLSTSAVSDVKVRVKDAKVRSSGQEIVPELVKSLNVDDWTPIYRFNHIVASRAIQRLKIYQTGFTCFVILPWTVASSILAGSTDVAYFAMGISVLACVMLSVVGTLASRVIGIVYVNKNKKDPEQLRLARLTFFGSRIDTVVPVNSFIPITDSNNNLGDAYVELIPLFGKPQVERGFLEHSFPFFFDDKYYLSLKYGTIVDAPVFYSIFGDVSEYFERRNKK